VRGAHALLILAAMSSPDVSTRSPALWAALAGIGCCGGLMVLLAIGGAWLALARRAPPPEAAPLEQAPAPVVAEAVAEPGAPVTQEAAADGAPSGLYMRVQIWGGSITLEHFYFAPDGRVYQGVPPGGLDAGAIDRAAREAPNSVGSFELEGKSLVIAWPKREPRTYELERLDDGDLELDGIFTKRVGSFREGARLSARWGWSGTAGAGTGSVVSAARGLVLRADGTFDESGVGGVSATLSTGESVTGHSANQTRGTYTLGGNTLVLAHADGRVTRHTVYPYPDDGDPEARPKRLNVDGGMYSRED
jgi:hypothetical protein